MLTKSNSQKCVLGHTINDKAHIDETVSNKIIGPFQKGKKTQSLRVLMDETCALEYPHSS